jgi:predicted DNA-binding protein
LQFALTGPRRIHKLTVMVVHLKAETESRLRQLAETTGRAPDELVEDAILCVHARVGISWRDFCLANDFRDAPVFSQAHCELSAPDTSRN